MPKKLLYFLCLPEHLIFELFSVENRCQRIGIWCCQKLHISRTDKLYKRV